SESAASKNTACTCLGTRAWMVAPGGRSHRTHLSTRHSEPNLSRKIETVSPRPGPGASAPGTLGVSSSLKLLDLPETTIKADCVQTVFNPPKPFELPFRSPDSCRALAVQDGGTVHVVMVVGGRQEVGQHASRALAPFAAEAVEEKTKKGRSGPSSTETK